MQNVRLQGRWYAVVRKGCARPQALPQQPQLPGHLHGQGLQEMSTTQFETTASVYVLRPAVQSVAAGMPPHQPSCLLSDCQLKLRNHHPFGKSMGMTLNVEPSLGGA
ncbi:hypothetical protein MLD38_000800 [Melastoma candidum]|uniref:Uncharacterized protein n=1 Tax=Melastoma candidum TaxID=119954 RepID=A0ACB9SJV0_9MYRT|nr:hypothetical protein MLD38_000800 [Melastoma candidum]